MECPGEMPWLDVATAGVADLPVVRIGACQSVRSVGIIGAGMMGTAIATSSVRSRVPVVLSDSCTETLTEAKYRITTQLAEEQFPDRTTSNMVRQAAKPADFTGCDVVLESVQESLPVKKAVYRECEHWLSPDAILASNTSTIPIAELAADLREPDRFCGIHFFHPVSCRPLVEIVRGPQTSRQTITKAKTFVRQIGKLPIVVSDGPGFLVNRLLSPYLNEAMELLLEGVAMETIESTVHQFGTSTGPFRLMDEIGLDTTLAGGMVLATASGERMSAAPLLVALVKAKRLGRKSGAGFFRYPRRRDDRPTSPDLQLARIVETWSRRPTTPDGDHIMFRLLLPMLLEATRLLQESKVANHRSIDLGVVFGLGFPAFGLLGWADALGPRQLLAELRRLEPLGERFRPTPLLLDMARHGRRFT